jgi:hypothetical protein
MKQTAVEWFVEQLKSTRKKYMGYKNIEIDYKELIQQAKAMEKEQIIESWDNGYDLGKHDDQLNPDDAEQYYNETFKSE